MLRQFEKYLNKKFGQEFKTDLEQAKINAEKLRVENEKKILEMKNTQKKIIRDLIETHDILYVDNVPLHNEKFKCQNVIGLEKEKCNAEFNTIETLFFSQFPPFVQGISKEDIMQSLYNINFHINHKCSCGRRYNLSNKK